MLLVIRNGNLDISPLSLQSSFQPALIGKPLPEANISNAMITSLILKNIC
jgi:hypothetical protein